jgi:hypothetical protein
MFMQHGSGSVDGRGKRSHCKTQDSKEAGVSPVLLRAALPINPRMSHQAPTLKSPSSPHCYHATKTSTREPRGANHIQTITNCTA